MSRYTIRQSGTDNWSSPRPFADASTRRQRYGRIQPMEGPNFFQRLLRRA